jgi:mannose-1-phosphate guanylyltransferase
MDVSAPSDEEERMREDPKCGDAWAIVLAGGQGSRLASLTHAIHCRPTPKQFAVIAGDESMLQATLRRTLGLVPPRRTVVVIGDGQLEWARPQLRIHPEIAVLVQPANLGTATGLLYALSWLRLHAVTPHVLMFPSDHFVERVAPFAEAVRDAEAISRTSGLLTLIGVAPDAADTEYGWLVPGPPLEAAAGRVLRAFVEKPPEDTATRLRAAGALWNTFILAAPATEVWRLARQHLPGHAAVFEALDRFSFSAGATDVHDAYQRLATADFSRDVLQLADRLAVVPMAGAGWSDWGTPARVLASLRGTPSERRVLAFIGQVPDGGRGSLVASESSTSRNRDAPSRPAPHGEPCTSGT